MLSFFIQCTQDNLRSLFSDFAPNVLTRYSHSPPSSLHCILFIYFPESPIWLFFSCLISHFSNPYSLPPKFNTSPRSLISFSIHSQPHLNYTFFLKWECQPSSDGFRQSIPKSSLPLWKMWEILNTDACPSSWIPIPMVNSTISIWI